MITWTANLAESEALYAGLRMTADEYFALEDDGHRYELIDGLVCMSPSPTSLHQIVQARIMGQLNDHVESTRCGEAMGDISVYLRPGSRSGDIAYRPDIVFLRSEKLERNRDRIVEPPDLVVEIISLSSRRMDHETKREDYERAGVGEYWIIDPLRREMLFLRLEGGKYVEVAPVSDKLESTSIPGFALDLARVRNAFPTD